LPRRFRFHGHAIGAAGRINKPFSELIEVQAASALPQLGGQGSARSCDFKYREILQFDLAHTEVTGSSCECDCDDDPTSFSTRITSTVEGLNILDMITADRVVATLASTYTAESDGEPSVRLIGTRFENLKIAGIPVEVDLAADVFDRFDTHRTLAHAYSTDDGVRDLIDQLTLKHRAKEAPAHILRWFNPSEGGSELPASRGITLVSLVRGLAPESPGLDCWGHVIHLAGFGTIRLAEVEISKVTRTVNMIQVNLDCPYKGQLMLCSIADGGDDY
jgi:hypothetical protein